MNRSILDTQNVKSPLDVSQHVLHGGPVKKKCPTKKEAKS